MTAPLPSPLRRAASPDAPALAALCRACFPASLRWQVGGPPALRWWTATLAHPAAETWITDDGAGPRGFVLLVTDERAWADAPPGAPGADRLAAVVRHPGRALRCAVARRRATAADITDIPVAPLPSSTPEAAPAARTWIELVAVAPEHRGRGDAGLLLDHATARTRALGRTAIHLAVDVANTAALRCYARAGFGVVRSGDRRLVLALPITTPLGRAA